MAEYKNREERLAKGKILPTMLAMGIPTFVAQLVNILYNLVDRMFIGHIEGSGAAALTGVGVCFPIVTFISAFSSLVGAGGAPLAGIALGKGERKKAEDILGNGVTMLLSLAIVLTLVFQLIKKPFLYLFGASDATYAYGGPYLTIYLWGTVFVMLAFGLNTFITVQGASVTAMASILIGAILNLILDPILIFGFKMGVEGAALATIISQAASAAWILKFLTSEKATLRLKFANMKPAWRTIGYISALGISPFIMGATESLITIVFNSGAQKYGGDIYVGSITVVQSVLMMICTPFSGFSQGVQPIISYNYGAKNLDRVKKTSLALIAITTICVMSMCIVCMSMPAKIAGLFTTDGDLIELCEKVMPIFLAGMLVFGMQNGCQSSFMALGKVKQSLFFALFRKVILLTPLAIILPIVLNSVMGLYYAEPISDGLSAICCGITFVVTLRGIMKKDIAVEA